MQSELTITIFKKKIQNFGQQYIPYTDLSKYINSLDIGVHLPLCPDLISVDEIQDKPPWNGSRCVCTDTVASKILLNC